MSVAASVGTNFILRHWVAPAEAAVRAQTPHLVISHDVPGWRRGTLQGADAGYQVGSALTLPVDLIAGTLHGSAHAEVTAAHTQLQKETGGPLAPLSRKQRFLLRLEDGLFGVAYRNAIRLGEHVGFGVGSVAGVAVSGACWTLRAAGWAVGRLWSALTADTTHPRPQTPAPSPSEAWNVGLQTGQKYGKPLGGVAFGFSIGLASLAVTLSSAGVKGLCMAGGAIVGGLVGLGEDVMDAWRNEGVLVAPLAKFCA